MAGEADVAEQRPLLVADLENHRRVLLEHLHDEENRVIPMLLELTPEQFVTFTHGR